ncbi:MAG: amidohydrolase family protein [Rhodobacteraceae bacterium]|nr:amidohydrolase family protein [Paracoccaceae bacterium]
MIIDFRVRPPFRGFLSSFLYRPRDPHPDPVTRSGLQIGIEHYRSFEERSMPAFMEEMDEAGIAIGVVMGRAAPPPYNGVPNEDVSALLRDYPGRFIGFGAVSGMDVAGALAELDRIVDLGLVGVAVDNGYCDPPLYDDDPTLLPIYEKCQDLGLILSITSSIFLGPDLSYSSPVAIQRVARRFPGLRIVVPHASWPWTVQFCAVALQCTNVYPVPDLYLNVPHLPGADEYVKAANTYLSHRLLYASSYPVRPLGQSLRQFRELPFANDAIVTRCTGLNAKQLLGI